MYKTKIGKLKNIYILTKKFFKIYEFNNKEIIFTENLNSLDNKSINSDNILTSYNANIIVPTKTFYNFSLASNFHPGSYNFSCRALHHWACYQKWDISVDSTFYIKGSRKWRNYRLWINNNT